MQKHRNNTKSRQKGPLRTPTPTSTSSWGVGAVEDRFPAVDQHRTHTSTRGGRRFHVPKVRRKGAPNAHPGPGLHGRTLRKNIRKDQKSVHFWVRVSAIEMTSPSARFGDPKVYSTTPLGRPGPSLGPLYYYGAIEGPEKMQE